MRTNDYESRVSLGEVSGWLATLVVGWLFCGGVTRAAGGELHVAVDGNDANPGSVEKPLATPERARDVIRGMKAARGLPAGGVRVVVHRGQYFLPRTLTLGPEDSGTPNAPVVWEGDPAGEAVFSGGRVVRGWTHVKDNLWTVELPEVKAGTWYFRQLFANGGRLTRARLPARGFFITEGPLSKYADVAKQGNIRLMAALRTTHPDAFCGFQYKPGDGRAWEDTENAEVITFHSWECSWQTIRSVDAEKHEVHFNTPCRYPVGLFSPHCEYRVENVRAGLQEPGQWQLDRRTGVLSYLARPGEDPPGEQFVAPVMEKVVVLRGDYRQKKYVEYVAFHGITFSHAEYEMGVYDIAPGWPAQALKVDPAWPTQFPPGYTDAQAAPLCGQAVEFDGARSSRWNVAGSPRSAGTASASSRGRAGTESSGASSTTRAAAGCSSATRRGPSRA